MPRQKYDPRPVQELLRKLLERAGESYRQASLAAGLPDNAISKYMRGVRPRRDACIALADHFGVDPNELLQAAGYEPLRFFDPAKGAPEWQSPEAAEIAKMIDAIQDPVARKRVARAVKVLLRGYLGAPDSRSEEAKGPATEAASLPSTT